MAKKLKLHGTKKTALIAASAVGGVVLGAFLGPYVAQLSKYGIQLIKKNISYGAAAGKALCFVSGTLILTEEGLVPIEKLREGDYVYAEDINTGEQELKEIIQIYENQTQEVVCLKLKGEEIITTPYHPIYIDGRGWVAAVKVKNGDVLHTFDGKKILVEKVQYRKLEKPVKVYNFEVRDFHTYYVGKNNFQNDELTFKMATGNDWWFHAKKMAGSHVIVKTPDGEIPDRTFEEAGRLAAYYSKGRTAPKVEIDYIQRKHVKKAAGGAPGFVIYHTNYSLMAIPKLELPEADS